MPSAHLHLLPGRVHRPVTIKETPEKPVCNSAYHKDLACSPSSDWALHAHAAKPPDPKWTGNQYIFAATGSQNNPTCEPRSLHAGTDQRFAAAPSGLHRKNAKAFLRPGRPPAMLPLQCTPVTPFHTKKAAGAGTRPTTEDWMPLPQEEGLRDGDSRPVHP